VGRFRVYLKPFTDEGIHQDDWIDVSNDVDMAGMGVSKQSLDNNEYNIGIFKNSGVQITLANISGRYSDVGQPGSIFKYRRSNSLVRITWEIMDYDVVCGFAVCGNVALSEEVEAFTGLLDDAALKQEAEDQNLKFKVLGKESIFGEALVPFGSIANGDTLEDILLAVLDQPEITDILAIDPSDINCGVNAVVDDVSSLENKTVREALAEILPLANSVLYILSDGVIVSPRAESAELKHTFYGQGAILGIENIHDLSDFRSGLNRLFNFWTWADTSLVSQNVSSVGAHGVRKKELSTDLITNDVMRQAILDSLKTEFAEPRRELVIRAPIDYDTISLNVLDKVAVDYPNVAINDTAEIPFWDLATWDEARFPYEILPIAIEASARFKILSRDIDPTNHEMVFYLREVG
jgi:hypothetical protein